MCHFLYIASNEKVNLQDWQEDGVFYISSSLLPEEIQNISPKMKNSFICKIGAFNGCACDFIIDNYFFQEDNLSIEEIDYDLITQEKELKTKSILKLIKFISSLTNHGKVEFYSCWHEDLSLPIKHEINLEIEKIVFEKNYFNLVERQKIIFT